MSDDFNNNYQNEEWERDYTIEGEEPQKFQKHPLLAEFFGRYAYDSIKMFVNQFAMAIFGLVVALAVSNLGDGILLGVSIASILFYLFLIYVVAWQSGAKDKISIELKKKKYKWYIPILVSLLANAVNFVLALVYVAGKLAGLDTVAAVGKVGVYLIEGMYTGLLATQVMPDIYLRDYWFMYFVIIVPSILISWLGYTLGTKNLKMTKILTPQFPESDRPTKQEERERKKK